MSSLLHIVMIKSYEDSKSKKLFLESGTWKKTLTVKEVVKKSKDLISAQVMSPCMKTGTSIRLLQMEMILHS